MARVRGEWEDRASSGLSRWVMGIFQGSTRQGRLLLQCLRAPRGGSVGLRFGASCYQGLLQGWRGVATTTLSPFSTLFPHFLCKMP